jgi:hypothetical protein
MVSANDQWLAVWAAPMLSGLESYEWKCPMQAAGFRRQRSIARL